MTLQNELIQGIGNLILGKEATLALTLLRLIFDAAQKQQTDDMAPLVYRQAPKAWKAPKGIATKAEFVDLVQAGQHFLSKIRDALKTA